MKIEPKTTPLGVENAKNNPTKAQNGRLPDSHSAAPRDLAHSPQTALLRQKVQASPDFDQARVTELKARVQKGEYKLDPAVLARLMLKKSQQEDL